MNKKWIEDMGAKAGFPLKSKGAVIVKIDEIYGVAPGPGAGKNSLRKKEAYAMPEEFKPGCARPTGGPVGEAVKTEATQPDI